MKKIISLILLLYISLISYTQTTSIKLYYLYNIIKYTSIQNNTYIMYVYNDEKFTDTVSNYFKNKKINNRNLIIKNITNINEYRNCSYLYITNKKSCDIITVKNTENLLLITEKSNMVKYGSCVNFFSDENTLKFSISKDNAEKNHITFNQILIDLSKKEKEAN